MPLVFLAAAGREFYGRWQGVSHHFHSKVGDGVHTQFGLIVGDEKFCFTQVVTVEAGSLTVFLIGSY
ncbi:unnamed protein product [Victoria cruziana]